MSDDWVYLTQHDVKELLMGHMDGIKVAASRAGENYPEFVGEAVLNDEDYQRWDSVQEVYIAGIDALINELQVARQIIERMPAPPTEVAPAGDTKEVEADVPEWELAGPTYKELT